MRLGMSVDSAALRSYGEFTNYVVELRWPSERHSMVDNFR